MAITVDTVASVRVVPDLSAFTQAEGVDIADVAYSALGAVGPDDLQLLADALLEHFWIVPKS